MKAQDNNTEAFERRARELLESSTERLEGRVRSRLTQARFAALEEARRARRWLGWRTWIPAGALAGAAALAIVLWSGHPEPPTAALDARNSLDDLEIVAGGENFELLENLDFYEWVSTVDATDIG